MRHKYSLLFSLILLSFPSYGHAQLWSGIVAPSRATNWGLAGVEGGIPSASWPNCNNTACNNLAPGGVGSVTGTTIQTAINGAQVNGVACTPAAPCVVRIRAGSFTTSTGFSISRSGVVVRGQGANQTFLVISGTTGGVGCGYGFAFSIALCASSSVPQSTATWTAGYAQGTTRITLGSSAGIAVGSVLILDQLDEVDNWPSPGYSFSCFDAGTCSNQGIGSPGGSFRDGRGGGTQIVRVTNVVGGNQFDITPPISIPNIRSGQSPGVLYASNVSNILTYAGLENLSLNYTGNQGAGDKVGVGIFNAANSWVRGTRIIYGGGVTNSNIRLVNALFVTLRDNYIANGYYQQVESYPIYTAGVGNILIENNICQGPSCDHITDGTYVNSVMSYNFFPGLHGPGILYHGGAQAMNLFEGNVTMGWGADITHGTSQFNTVFRNAMIGRRYGPTEVGVGNSAYILAHNRFVNWIGNVMGDTHYTVYEDTPSGGNSNNAAIYTLGGPGNNSGDPQTADPRVKATLMRWGNWDKVTNATRWCGNSSNTGWTTTCASTSEVPSGLSYFANAVPATTTLPASFYLISKPSWWPTGKPWPSIGPDVTGGNITNMAGHAYTNPAADCYLNVMGGPSDGSGEPLSFDAGACYGNSSPAAPTNLTVTGQ